MPLKMLINSVKRSILYGKIQRIQYAFLQRRHFCNLLEQPKTKVKAWLQSFDTVISDGDGVLWDFNRAITGSPEVMQRFQQLNKQVFICTNNSTKTRQELYKKAQQLGYDICEKALLCSARATAKYLCAQSFDKSVYLIGSNGIASELDAVGIAHNPPGPDIMKSNVQQYVCDGFAVDVSVGAVVVGFDAHFSFVKLVKAATYLTQEQCLFLATNRDDYSLTPTKVLPCAGSFVQAVETCAGRIPLVLGKPNKEMCKKLIEEGSLKPARTLMIGDNCRTDVLFGHNCGFQTLLVGTGKHQPHDVLAFQRSDDPAQQQLIPDVFLPKLGDLLCFM